MGHPHMYLADMMEAIWGPLFESPCGFSYFRRFADPDIQSQIGHDDCPLYSSNDDHDCSGIHTRSHDVPQCALGATIAPVPSAGNPTDSSEVSSARAASAGLAVAATFAVL